MLKERKDKIVFTITAIVVLAFLASMTLGDVIEITLEYDEDATTTTTVPGTTTTTSGTSSPSAPSGPSGPSAPAATTTTTVPEIFKNGTAAFEYSVKDTEVIVYEDETHENTIKIRNSGAITLNSVKLKVVGIPEQWFESSPSFLSRLTPGDSIDFTYKISPGEPGSFEYELVLVSDQGEKSIFKDYLDVNELTEEVKEERAQKRLFDYSSTALLIFGIAVPASIAALMILRIRKDKCPVCGEVMKRTYKGRAYETFMCPKCEHRHVKVVGESSRYKLYHKEN